MSTTTIQSALVQIQGTMSVPKGQLNDFGGYKFRSAEDIMNAVKPFIKEHKCILLLTDELVLIMDRFYVKATATLMMGEDSISVSAFARETETKKGMDEAQVTGSASSYARKYAMNGLFCIDDVKDADSQDNSGHTPTPKNNQNPGKQQSGQPVSISRDDYPGFGKHASGGKEPKMWKDIPKHYLEWLSTADKTRDDVKAFVIQELKFRASETKPKKPGASIADQVAMFEKVLNDAMEKFKRDDLFATFAGFLNKYFKTTEIASIALEYVNDSEPITADLFALYTSEMKAKKAVHDA